MDCLPSPSHRKSSSLAQTSPGAAPGACVGRRNAGATPCPKSLCQGEAVPKFPSVGGLLPILHPSSGPPSYPVVLPHGLRCHSYVYSPNSKCITCPLHPVPSILSTFLFSVPYPKGHSFSPLNICFGVSSRDRSFGNFLLVNQLCSQERSLSFHITLPTCQDCRPRADKFALHSQADLDKALTSFPLSGQLQTVREFLVGNQQAASPDALSCL